MRRLLCVLPLVIYVALYVLGVGAVHAQWMPRRHDGIRNVTGTFARDCRGSLWFAYGWNVIPLAPLVAIVVTAGYADGFRYSCVRTPRAV